MSGNGLAYSEDGSAANTDGSSRSGHIKLNPEKSGGAKGVLSRLSDGTMVTIGEDAPDGSVFYKVSGQWKAGTQTESKTTFLDTELLEYSNAIATFGCGPNGTVKLGKMAPCLDSLVYYNEAGRVVCLNMDDLALLLFKSLCAKAIPWDGVSCINGLMACTPDGMRLVKPIGGKTLYGDPENASCWVMNDLNAPSGNQLKLIFKYTGGIQYFTVPEKMAYMTLKVWGAGGSWDYAGPAARGGLGGFTTLKYPVVPGQIYAVVVGYGADLQVGQFYGFGGSQSADGHNHAGGGLAGVFTGNTNVLATDSARAVAIAGGGGAGSGTAPNTNIASGGSGNASTAGGLTTMQGSNGTNGQFTGTGGCGGGYAGGTSINRYGFGGSGYVSPLGTLGSIQFADDTSPNNITDLPPNSTDPDWDATYKAGMSGKSGLVVVVFSVN